MPVGFALLLVLLVVSWVGISVFRIRNPNTWWHHRSFWLTEFLIWGDWLAWVTRKRVAQGKQPYPAWLVIAGSVFQILVVLAFVTVSLLFGES